MRLPRQDNFLTGLLTLVLLASCLSLVHQWVASADAFAAKAVQVKQ